MIGMSVTVARLSQSKFENDYGEIKPYHEYWHGEAVQKSMPNFVHGLLQFILMQVLVEAGYKAAAEVRLKIDPDLQLLPDVIATRGRVEMPYPTVAVEVVAEILSPDDAMERVIGKCRAYDRWGFTEIFVLNPEKRMLLRWQDGEFEERDTFVAGIPAAEIWDRLDRMTG